MNTIDKRFVPTASIKRAILCLEDRWTLRQQVLKGRDLNPLEREIETQSASIDRSAIGDLKALLDLARIPKEIECCPQCGKGIGVWMAADESPCNCKQHAPEKLEGRDE